MTIVMFITLFTVGSAASSLLTEALKKAFQNMSSNLLALIDALVVGGLGTVVYYILTDVEFNLQNIVCAVLMACCVWVGSMVGYDKVVQLLSQLAKK